MEQRSARTTQQDPHGDAPRSGRARRGSRLPHPAPPSHERERERGRGDGWEREGAREWELEGYEHQRQSPDAYGGAPQDPAPGPADERAPARASRTSRGSRASRTTPRASSRSPAGPPSPGSDETEGHPRPPRPPRPRSRPEGGGPRSGRSAPRLTALGTGVFSGLLMMGFGWLEGALFGGAPAVYGVLFVLVSTVGALWVRPAELYAAPAIAPLAYTLGLFFAGGSGDGAAGVVQNVFTSLALHAVWLYAGTLIATLIVLVRKVVLVIQRRRQRRRAAAQQQPQ